jgi:hypothetical protein
LDWQAKSKAERQKRAEDIGRANLHAAREARQLRREAAKE